ncbi:MAG TPA: SPOR domain-containing protein [Rhodocyclaceae bacterium]|nr:SPOR domain-containing protein [Rhodocyclaceae bacterium]
MERIHGQRGGTLLGILIGLVLGALISFGVVYLMNKSTPPFRDKGARTDRPGNGDSTEPPATPAPLPGKPGDKVGEKPRFEFYKILPGSQEAAPAPAPAQTKAPADSKSKTSSSEPLYLQVGAFQKPVDADNLKAKLALIGLEAGVQEVDVPEKGRMYRVRTGPFANVDAMNRARDLLSQNGIQAAPVKGK